MDMFTFRPTAAAFSGTEWDSEPITEKIATIERIKGKTMAFNQLTKDGSFVFNITITNSIIKANYLADVETPQGGAVIDDLPVKHKLLFIAKGIAQVRSLTLRFCNSSAGIANTIAVVLPVGDATIERVVDVSGIVTSPTQPCYLQLLHQKSTTVNTVFDFVFQVFDLTQMFGAGNEPATVEEFRAIFPLDYYVYNPGELISFTGTGLKTVGFNQWDEEWEAGYINSQTGQPSTNSGYSRSKNFCDCLPSISYNLSKPAGTWLGIFWYDCDKNYISYNASTSAASYTCSSPSNARYFKICVKEDPNANDSCIHLVRSGARDGEYEQYWDRTLSLPISTYFPDGMKSAGTAFDELTKNKAIKRIGSIDLGQATWSISGTGTSRYAYILIPGRALNCNGIISRMPNFQYSLFQLNKNNTGIIFSGISEEITAPEIKAALSGIMLYYELEEPIETTISPELSLSYRVDGFGTEMLLPQNTSIPTTIPLDADFTYIDSEEYLTNTEDLISVANAIRAKGSITNRLTYPDEWIDAIESIETGVTPSGNIELTQQSGTNVSSYATASVRGASISLNAPTINSAGLVTASASLTVAGWTEVAPEQKTLQLSVQSKRTVTPSASAQTAVTAGKYTTGDVVVAAVPTETTTATMNGTITPTSGKFFSSVTVAIPEYDGSVSS